MPHTADHPAPTLSRDELIATIPGWGADLDPLDRPSVPREDRTLESGAWWTYPDRQPHQGHRECSVEHVELPPVFGTSVPLRGLSGAVRRHAYARFSEARAAHWLLLLAADRIDVVESHARSWRTSRPDNPVMGTGLRAELSHHGLASRVGRRRVDLNHQWIDPLVVAGPWIGAGVLALRAVRSVSRRVQPRHRGDRS